MSQDSKFDTVMGPAASRTVVAGPADGLRGAFLKGHYEIAYTISWSSLTALSLATWLTNSNDPVRLQARGFPLRLGEVDYVWHAGDGSNYDFFFGVLALSGLFSALQSRGVSLRFIGLVIAAATTACFGVMLLLNGAPGSFGLVNAALIFTMAVTSILYFARFLRGLRRLQPGILHWIGRFLVNLIWACGCAVAAYSLFKFAGAEVMAFAGGLFGLWLVMKPFRDGEA